MVGVASGMPLIVLITFEREPAQLRAIYDRNAAIQPTLFA